MPIAATVMALTIGWRFAQVGMLYRHGSDLALPGAAFLRLPPETTALFRLLVLNAGAHGDMLFSEPGMFSFNLWSGLPAPTTANVTHWFSLLSPARQQDIIAALEAHPRTCLIVQRDHIDYLTRRNLAPAGTLHDYVTNNFAPVFSLDDFEFHVRHGRTIDPLLVGEILVHDEGPDGDDAALRLRVLLPANRSINRIELSAPRAPGEPPLILDASNARVEVTPTNLQGVAAGPAMKVAWPFQIDGAATLMIHFNRFNQPPPPAGGLITLRGPDGRETALARLKQ